MRFLLLACTAAVGFAQLPHSLPPDKITDIERLITMEMSRQQIPGLSIAIAQGKDVLWAGAYGFSDLENFVPAKESTVFRTASIAKPITAVAALQLAERGLLDLDAPVQKYVPSFPQKPWPITMRQLLGHLAGIRTYKDIDEDFNTRHYGNLAGAVRVFENDPLAAEPGGKFLYSTFGFDLAGLVVERVSGRTFAEYLQENIFNPAGMPHTRIDDVYALIPNRSRGYSRSPDGAIQNAALLDTSLKVPGGGLASTAADIVNFALAVDRGKLLAPSFVEQMFTSQRTIDGKPTKYGLGWGIGEFRGHLLRSHSGGQAGVSTMFYYFPAEHAAIAVLSNLEQSRLEELVRGVAEIVLELNAHGSSGVAVAPGAGLRSPRTDKF